MNEIEITSTQNNFVKFCVKLQNSKFRKSEKLILVDGAQTIEGFVDDNVEFEYIFIKKDNPLKKNIKAKNIFLVNDEILAKISTTKSPTSVVGIIKEPVVDRNIFKNLDKIVLIDGIKDAGNLGTIIRSAAAFGINGILLFNDCVDLYNSKVIRSTAQNIFKIPVIKVDDINFLLELKKTHKFISTVVDTRNDFMEYKFDDKFILAFGSEAFGISKEIEKITDEKLTFFMQNNVESLNLAICASIAFAFISYKK